jgi:hypothetical protein
MLDDYPTITLRLIDKPRAASLLTDDYVGFKVR